MSVGASENEPNQQGQPNQMGQPQMGQGDGDNPEVQPNSNGNPAWQELLDQLPEEFHGLVTPKLQDWDTRVQDKLTEVRSQYDPYKPIVDNKVPMERIEQALYVAHLIDTQPEQLVGQLIDHYNLEQYKQQQQQANNSNNNPNPDEDEDMSLEGLEDLENHPVFKQLLEKQQELNEWAQSQRQEKEAQTNQEKMDEYLDGLKEEHGEFDRLYVTTLMANGFDGTEAVQQYQDTVKNAASALLESQQQNNPQTQPPVVMGGSGSTGSGIPEQNVDLGALDKGALNDLVVQMIEQGNKS